MMACNLEKLKDLAFRWLKDSPASPELMLGDQRLAYEAMEAVKEIKRIHAALADPDAHVEYTHGASGMCCELRRQAVGRAERAEAEMERLRQERDEAAAEAAACVAFLQNRLHWEGFWAEGFMGQEPVSAADKNARALSEHLKATGHGKRMLDEIERLRAIVDRLPKTADGVPVVPLRSTGVYRITHGGLHIQESCDWSGEHPMFRAGDDGEPTSGRVMLPCGRCYSTREAAEAARNQVRGE